MLNEEREEKEMVYGYYITDTVGNKHFFIEGCSYCQMSTGGQHEPNCPLRRSVAETSLVEGIIETVDNRIKGDRNKE